MKPGILWKKYGRAFIYLAFSAVILYIMLQTPYCHDEWKWGSAERVELMKRGFANYNGRYLGDLLALAITRSVLVKTLVMAGVVVLSLHTVEANLLRGADRRSSGHRFLLLCAVVLLLALPRTLYAQSYGWPAAFVNFVPPAPLLLLYFNWTESLYLPGTQPGCTRTQALLAVPLGLATQLFSEHTTLFALLYAAWVLLFALIRRKKICAAYVTYFLSVLAGAAVMFSNEVYLRSVLQHTGYKKIHLSLSLMYRQFAEQILGPLFLDNWLLNTLIAAVLILCIVRAHRKTAADTLPALVLCGYSLYCIWHKIYPSWVFAGNTSLNQLIEIGISFLFFVSVLSCVWRYVSPGERLGILILYVSSCVMSAPLMAADPVGARCFYVSYLFQAMALLKITKYLLGTQTADLYYPMWIAGCAAAVLCVVYVRMFSLIGATDRTRAELIRTAVEQEAESVTLPLLPYPEYTWTTSPSTEHWARYFKDFYGIPQEMGLGFQ